MGLGQRHPPPQRRPFREYLPPSSRRKSDHVSNRRPTNKTSHGPVVDFHQTLHTAVSSGGLGGNVFIPSEGWDIYHFPTQTPAPPQILDPGTSFPWTINGPAESSPLSIIHPRQDHYDSSRGFAHFMLPGPVMQQPQPSYNAPQSFQMMMPSPNHNINHQQEMYSGHFQTFHPVPATMSVDRTQHSAIEILPTRRQVTQHSLMEQMNGKASQVPLQMQPQIMGVQTLPISQATAWQFQTSQRSFSDSTINSNISQPVVSEAHGIHTVADIAYAFTEKFCPYLESTPYCHPPVLRSRHNSKASRQLVQGMESEQRVIGTFERYFADSQTPVFMLCHYPISGFLQAFFNKNGDAQDVPAIPTRETVTLILLSPKFRVTTITVSILSGSSDLGYIQRGIIKAAGHLARCSKALGHWLSQLGLRADIREVLALPNMKRSVMYKLTKEKALQKNLSQVGLLHQDDLCAPFEEEWSKASTKKHFSEWIRRQVLTNSPSLNLREVKIIVGALLCPQLSRVEYMKDVETIEPIPDEPQYSLKNPASAEDVGQLQLTIDGVTMAFDTFMDSYLTCYFPELETKTYRVPPLHFNIQSFKKGTDYLHERHEIPAQVDLRGSNKSSSMHEDQRPYDAVANAESCLERDGSNPFGSTVKDNSGSGFMPSGTASVQAVPVHCNNCTVCPVNSDEEQKAYEEEEEDGQNSICFESPPMEKVVLDSGPAFTQVPFAIDVNSSRLLKEDVNATKKQRPVFPYQPFQGGLAHHRPKLNESPSKQDCAEVEAPVYSQQEAHQVILQDTIVMNEVMAKDARADEGESRVISAMELLGENFGPMFIVCSYQYNNYLNKLREEMFSKGEATRPTRAFGQIMRAEHDCVIFHKNLGLLIVCIKAIGDNFSDWQASPAQAQASISRILRKALQQLQREKAMIRHVTSDLGASQLFCHCLVALPNLYREQVDAALSSDPELAKDIDTLTSGRGSQSFLCLDELPWKNGSLWDPAMDTVTQSLVKWWKGFQQSIASPENAIDPQIYRRIVGRYCGLLSTVEVWTPSNPRVEVRSMSEAVNLCAQRMSQVILLPSQLGVLLSDQRRMYLYGPPGSGKTMLFTLKAREWLLRGNTVIVINTRWASSAGFPYAYGILERLRKAMVSDGLPPSRLYMLNLDLERFQPELLARVLPSSCILMDELTPAALPVVEHLCCLQVQNIWCAGLFPWTCPDTAHHFQAVQMEEVLRCPPIIQAMLKRLETNVKHSAPYKKFYREEKITVDTRRSRTQRSDASVIPGEELSIASMESLSIKDTSSKKSNVEGNGPDLKYDVASLNKRLARYSISGTAYGSFRQKPDLEKTLPHNVMELSSLMPRRALNGLPSDGPRPHIIDHREHLQPGMPADCPVCGQELADFLLSMVKNNRSHAFGKSIDSHNSHTNDVSKTSKLAEGNGRVIGRGRNKKPGEASSSVKGQLTSESTTVNITDEQKLASMFNQRALSWTDVVVTAASVTTSSNFVRSLQYQGIPVEVTASPHSARHIDTIQDGRTLFVTSYKEMTGLERAVIVFVPAHAAQDPLALSPSDTELQNLRDTKLRSGLQRYREDDKRTLWFVASRCLAQLVLILPG